MPRPDSRSRSPPRRLNIRSSVSPQRARGADEAVQSLSVGRRESLQALREARLHSLRGPAPPLGSPPRHRVAEYRLTLVSLFQVLALQEAIEARVRAYFSDPVEADFVITTQLAEDFRWFFDTALQEATDSAAAARRQAR